MSFRHVDRAPVIYSAAKVGDRVLINLNGSLTESTEGEVVVTVRRVSDSGYIEFERPGTAWSGRPAGSGTSLGRSLGEYVVQF